MYYRIKSDSTFYINLFQLFQIQTGEDTDLPDIGTPEIRDFDGSEYFYFTANNVSAVTWTYYDLTVTDGIHEVIVTIRIQVDNLE
jgi:hypothetical protein